MGYEHWSNSKLIAHDSEKANQHKEQLQAAALCWSDLKWQGNKLEVNVKRAKNDQLARGRSTFVDVSDSQPVGAALARWKGLAQCERSAFVFSSMNDSRPLSSRHLAKEVSHFDSVIIVVRPTKCIHKSK